MTNRTQGLIKICQLKIVLVRDFILMELNKKKTIKKVGGNQNKHKSKDLTLQNRQVEIEPGP